MAESNFCSICGQRWTRHSSDRCDEIAQQFENNDELEEEIEGEEIRWSQFGDRLDDGFRMMSEDD